MDVPLIGVCGREDAIVLQGARCDKPGKLYNAPREPWTAEFGENLDMESERFGKIAGGILAEMVNVLQKMFTGRGVSKGVCDVLCNSISSGRFQPDGS